MNKRSLAACVTVVLGAAGLISDTSVAAPPGPQRRVIVQFDGDVFTNTKGRRLGLINAVAMTASDSEIAKLTGVRAVWPDAPVKAHVDVSTSLVGATEVREKHNATGRGVKVAVIDTGVDYTHPDLAGRVVKGYDFANGDADPMDDHGHGTHVAGIIGGKAAAPGGVTGVAPEATIVAYKVLDEYGDGYTSDIVAAIEAASGQADVINLSLGGPGDGTDPMSLAAKAASDRGAVVVAAAGNAGPGRDTISSPAVAESVIAVGASNSNLRLPVAHVGNTLLQTWRGAHSANPPASPVTADVVHVTDWASAPDVRGKVVRFETPVPRAKQDISSWDIELAREAETRGAIALLGGWPGQVQSGPSMKADAGVSVKASGDLLVMDRLVVMGMDQTQYDELTRMLAAGRVQVTLKGEDVTDRLASFSSRGPSPAFGLKPDLVAPGVEIRSTIPTGLFEPGQYRLSGTSMAAPHVAGAAALLRQLNPGRSPAEIHSRLVNSSKPLSSGTELSAHGAGRLDVVGAVGATLTADPAVLSFGLADLSQRDIGGSRRLTVRNTGARAVLARLDTGNRDVRVSREWVLLPAGGATTVTVTIRAANPNRDTTVEGLLSVQPLFGGASIRVPYLLVARPLIVRTSPDPSDGTSTAYIYSYAPLASPPVVRVRSKTVTAQHSYGNWYTAALSGFEPGAYEVSVRATAVGGQVLTGTSGFEVTPEETRKIRWEPVGPLSEGGDLALSPSAPEQAVMAQYNKAGPWLTTDAGRSWTQLNRLPVAGGIELGTVVVDAQRAERFWYAVNDVMTGLGRVLRTDDRGKTWRALPVPAGFIHTMVADDQTRVLAAVSADGFAVSTDGGDSWTAHASGVDGEVTHAALVGNDLYLGTFRGVWVRRGITGEAELIYDAGNNFVYGVVANGTVVAALVPQIGVVGSYDGGRTWSTLLDHRAWGFALMRSGDDLFLSGTVTGSRVSHDNGRTWSVLDEPLDSAVFLDYDRWADGSITMTAEGAGVYRGSADGTGYRRIGVQGISINALAFSGGTMLAGTSSGLYRATLPLAGPEWGASGGEGYIGVTVSHLAVSRGVAWRVQRSAFGSFNVERSTDGGQTWETKGTWAEVPLALAIHPADPNRVAVSFWSLGGSGLYSTADGGTTWKNLYHDAPLTAVAGDPSHPDRWWLGDDSGLYRSDDNGTTKTKLADGPVTTLVHTTHGLVIGGSSLRVLRDGRLHESGTGTLPMKISDVVQSGATLYAATTSYWENGVLKGGRGVLRSTDGGRTWHNISGGLQNLDTTRLAIGPDGYLYVGTIDGGVHRTRIG